MRTVTALLAAVCLCAPAVFAQSPGGKRPGLLQEIRSRLSFRSASEVWEEARLNPSVDQARPMMESLLERRGDPLYAARAALWLGHLEYGAQQTERALEFFEVAAGKAEAGPERAEASFWATQCRALLGRGDDRASRTGGLFGVLEAMARADAELRAGRAGEALRGFILLEGDARRAGCLGPLLYRIGLANASTGGADARDSGPIWEVIARWAHDAPVSPERALAAAMVPEPAARPQPTPPPTVGDSTGGAGASGAGPNSAGPDGAGASGAGSGSAEPDGSSRRSSAYAVQLGAFHDPERARSRLAQLTAQGLPVRVEREERDGETFYKIRLGEARSREEAQELALRFCRGLEYQIVRVEP
jgi:hypothetical protein